MVAKRILSLILVLLMAALFFQLGRWQLHRLDERKAWNKNVNEKLMAPVVDATSLLSSPDGDVEYRRVSFAGTFDSANETLIRGRYNQGRYGYEVITPLRPSTGKALLVDRGWIPAGNSATDAPDVPPPPGGIVTVEGRVRWADSKDRPGPNGSVIGLPVRAANRISPDEISANLTYPVLPGYIEMLSPQTQAPVQIPAPLISEGPHLAYAVQWFFFSLLALISPLFFRRIRHES